MHQGNSESESSNLLEIEEFFPKNQKEIISNSIATNDAKTIHDKIQKYDQLDTEQRRSIVRNLPALVEQLGVERSLLLKSLFNQMIKDKDDISLALLQKIGQVSLQLQKCEDFQQNIKGLLIPTLNYYLNHNQLEVKEQAGKVLAELANKLNDKDRGDYVLKHVIEMAHDDQIEENRIVAVQLFSSMSECFGQSLCEQFIGLQILSLGEDISLKVRKQAIKHLPVIAKLVNPQFFSRLFQFYQSKTKDNSNWVIRKACVDILLEISQLCGKQQREGPLTEVMLRLLRDTNKWVKVSAYKQLGPFIHLLKNYKLNAELLKQFCRMVESDVASLGKQNQIVYNCAFNFPAVLDAVGKEKWESNLLNVYDRLLKRQQKQIKITLSQSLHEIAKILGEEYTEKHLFRVVDMFFKDRNDQIKLGVIRSMAELMKVLSEEKRQSLVGVFEEFQTNQKKWRIRQCICKQLGHLITIYKPQIVFQYLVPILLKFCSDTVSLIREEAASKVAKFIDKLSEEEPYMLGLIESVKAFGASPKYTQRQAFLVMCEQLMNNRGLFEKHFMQTMMELADDKVVNVKLVLAQIVKKHMEKKGALAEDEALIKLMEKLKTDPNEEVSGVFEQN